MVVILSLNISDKIVNLTETILLVERTNLSDDVFPLANISIGIVTVRLLCSVYAASQFSGYTLSFVRLICKMTKLST